jgi:hypothetical protein
MRLLKKIFPIFAAFAAFFLLTTSSCNDRCAYLECKNGSSCESGKCYCKPYFYGEQCELKYATKFVGSFTTVNAADCNRVFSSDITATSDSTLKIRNLGGFINTTNCTEYWVTAKLKSSTTFKVDETFCTDFHITADGVYNEATRKLTITYNCIHNGTTDNCKAVYSY